MSGTSVPGITFATTGPVVPLDSDVLRGVQADLNAAFGGRLNQTTSNGDPTNATPQEQLANSLTAIIGDKNDQMLALAAGFDPATSSGRFQDALARIYFLTRQAARATVLEAVLCTGAAGVTIPAGSRIQAADGNLYASQILATITANGTVSVPFACLTSGPVQCPAQTFAIQSAVPGWDSAASAAAGVVGAEQERRTAFEARRRQSVAQNSLGGLPSVLGAVLSVPGVLDAYVTDNPAGSAQTIGGVSLAAHSLWVCVAGGDPLAVATAIWKKKAPGCGYNGNTTVTVQDSASGYSAPYPSYPVTFQTATPTPVYFAVSIQNGPDVPSNAAAQIQAAIIAAFAGQDGGQRERIGGTVFASRYNAPVAAVGSWVRIIDINTGLSANPTGNTATLRIDQVPTVGANTIAVQIV